MGRFGGGFFAITCRDTLTHLVFAPLDHPLFAARIEGELQFFI